jgi:ethanolamine permease
MTAEPTARPTPSRVGHHAGVEAERVDAGYLEKRRLRTGTAGWLLLAGLGVSAVISVVYGLWFLLV